MLEEPTKNNVDSEDTKTRKLEGGENQDAP